MICVGWRPAMNNEKKIRQDIIKKIPKFKYYVTISLLLASIIQLISLIPPLIMRNIIDIYIPDGNLQQTLTSIVFFVLIPVVSTLLSTYYNYLITVIARNSGRNLIGQAFEKIIYQPMKYFDKNNSAEIATYCKTEAMNYVVFWLMTIPQLIAGVLSGIVVYVLMFAENYLIAIGLLLYIPMSILPSKKLASMIQNEIKIIVENNAKTNQLIVSAFKGIKYIKSMKLEAKQILKIDDINKKTVNVWSRTAAIEHLNSSWVGSFVDSLFIGVTFAVASIMIINQMSNICMLVLYLGFLPLFFASVKAVANVNFEFSKQMSQYDEFFKLLVMEDDRSLNATEKLDFKEKIKISDVTFSYGHESKNILSKTSIEFRKNEWTGIVGSSGKGKSTILELILRFYDDYEGSIEIDGVDIRNVSLSVLRKKITHISQDTFLLPGTLRENMLAVKSTATEEELLRMVDVVQLTDFIKQLPDGLDTDIGEDGTLVSGGEKQRICLAIGLLRDSEILLLDEITSSLDEKTEIAIRDNIKELMKIRKLTIVSISHREAFLELADKIINLDENRT